MKTIITFAVLLMAVPGHAASPTGDGRTLESRLAEDLTRIDGWRSYQSALLQELERLMLRGKSSPLSPQETERLVRTWSGIVDLQLALDVVDRRWRDRSNLVEGSLERSIATSYAAWLTRNTGAIAVVRLGRAHPDLQPLLDQPLSELGLPAGTWSRISQNAESARTSAEYLAFESFYANSSRTIPVSPAIAEDSERMSMWLQERGVQESAENASRLLSADPTAALNTLTSAGSPWFGTAQRLLRERPFIGTAWLRRALPRIQPGDLVLIRHEWNPMDPGHDSFWGQAGIWLGTPSERRHYFGDARTIAAMRVDGYEDVDALLRATSPSAYGATLSGGTDPIRMVVTTPLGLALVDSTALEADSIAVLRLRRSALDRARVVQRALGFTGRAWDAAGNVDDHSAIGAAELFIAALDGDAPRLEPARPGLDDVVRWFDEHGGDDNPTFELVLMLDGDPRTRNVAIQDSATFRDSWSRPVWQSWLTAASLNQRR